MRNRRHRDTATRSFDVLDDRVVLSAVGFRANLAELVQLRIEHRAALRAAFDARVGLRSHAHVGNAAGGGAAAPHSQFKVGGGSPSGSAETQASLPANVSPLLNVVYQQYEAAAGNGSGVAASVASNAPANVVVSGTSVGINAHTDGKGNYDNYVLALKRLGMDITGAVARTGTVAGIIPISSLEQAADLPQTLSLSPMFRPAGR